MGTWLDVLKNVQPTITSSYWWLLFDRYLLFYW